MPRCENCHGSIRTKMAMTHNQDPHYTVSKWEFDADVGWGRARKTHFCSAECAIKGLQEGQVLPPDAATLHVMRHEYDPGECEPDPSPLVERAKELLMEAQEQLDEDSEAQDYVEESVATAESAQVLIDGPEVLKENNV